jgi:CRISPR/Cas system-associated exonuclease Cas4 (RecB family)
MAGTERGFWGELGASFEVWSWSEMYARLTPRGRMRRQVDPPDHKLILEFVIGNNIDELDERGVEFPHGVRRRGFIDILSSTVRELLLEGVPPDILLSSGGQDGTISHGELLYRLYSDYLLYLEQNGLADNSQIPTLLADELPGVPERLGGVTLCWVGFLSFTGAQLKLLRGFRDVGLDMEFFIPQSGLRSFRDASEQMETHLKSLDGLGGALLTFTAQDMYWQYEGIAHEIELAMRGRGILHDALSELGADPAESLSDVGILVSRDRLELMASALKKHGVPCQSRAETQVSETIIMEAARGAWDAYSMNWPARKTMHLLKRCMGDLASSGGFSIQKQNGAILPEGARAWKEALADDPELLSLFERLERFCQYLDCSDGSGGRSCEELLRALHSLGGEEWEMSTALEAGDDHEMDFAVKAMASSRLEIEEKLEKLEELRYPLGPAGDVRFKGAGAMGFLLDWSQESAIVLSPPLKGAVALYDSPPSVLISHRLWIMTDVDPSRFPGASADAPLLNGDLREDINKNYEGRVHLPTMSEKREQQEALFRRLLCLGEDATLVARSAVDSRGRPQGDSPFISFAFSDADSGWRKMAEITFDADALLEGEQNQRGEFPRTAILQRSGGREKLRIAASSVDEFLGCPFSYWCGHIARIEAPRREGGVLDRAFLGTVMHEIWKRVWVAYLEKGGRASLHMILLSEWDDALESLSAGYPELRDPRASLELAGLRSDMANAAAAQDEAESRASSAGLKRAYARFEFNLQPYELANTIFVGRADRLDAWENTGVVLIDYKLGRSSSYSGSLQLASYAAMIRETTRETVAGFGYLAHRDGRINGSWSPEVDGIYGRGTKKGMDEKIEEAFSAMNAIDEIAASGVFQANYDSAGCGSCDWVAICRRAERYGAFEEGGETPGDDGVD